MTSQRVWKSGSLCGAVGVLALGTALPAWGQNLLVNPGFEAPPDPSNINSNVAGWTLVNDAQRAAFQNHTPGGRFMIWAKTFQPIGGGIYQDVNIVAGQNYDFSSFLWFEPGFLTITDPVAAQLGLSWFDAGNSPVGSPTFLNITPAANPPLDTWTEFSLSATAPVGAAKVRAFLGWDGGGPGTGAQSVFFDDAVLDGPGQPPTNAWVIDGSGDWNVSANWALGVVPTGAGTEAEFLGAITSDQTVYSNIPVTVGTIRFNNANTYVIAGAGALTLQRDSGGNALIEVQQGSQKINLPVRFNSHTDLTVAIGAALNLADPVTIAANRIVNTSGNVTISAPLTIETGGGLTMGSSGRLFGAPGLGTGARVDIKNNAVVVDYNPGPSPLPTIRSQVASGYNGGAWNGEGIVSSNANASTHGVGYAEASAVFSSFPATFAGMPVDETTILLRYTRYGDANLDGTVNLQDFNRLAGNFGSTGAVWSQGDFNYDSIVNLQDFNRLAANFGLQAGPDGPTPDDWAALAAAVPEPASAAALMLAGLLVGGRRRRRAVA